MNVELSRKPAGAKSNALPVGIWVAADAASPIVCAMYSPADLFDLSQTQHGALFEGCKHAWEVLHRLKDYVERTVQPGLKNTCDGRAYIGDQVEIGEGTVVEDGAMIKGPAIIGRNCQIRHNAYIREHVIVGDGCVVGNACELKHSVVFNGAQIPHFNYVGDSVLGYKAHLGAGVKISNVKVVPGNVCVELEGIPADTGLRKFGALIGDHSDVGCNAVLNPGSIIGRGCVIYPNVTWRGILPSHMIVKNKAAFEVVVRRPRSS